MGGIRASWVGFFGVFVAVLFLGLWEEGLTLDVDGPGDDDGVLASC